MNSNELVFHDCSAQTAEDKSGSYTMSIGILTLIYTRGLG